MHSGRIAIPLRLIIAAALVVIAVLALALLLLVTDTALSVWERLEAAPAWIRFGWIGVVATVTVLATFLAWRWLRPEPEPDRDPAAPTMDRERLDAELDASALAGVDIAPALAELAEQRRRREGGEVYIAIFGEVSAGKSSLVQALLPGADAPADARAGTTEKVRHFHWTADNGVLLRMALFALVLGVADQVHDHTRPVNWFTGSRFS